MITADMSILYVENVLKSAAFYSTLLGCEPVELDFGYTFAAMDPDGHRLRVCYLNPER